MGYRLTYIAVPLSHRYQLLRAMGLVETDATHEYFHAFDECGTTLPSGHYLVLANYAAPSLIDPDTLAAASAGTELYAGGVDEEVMSSLASCYTNGQQTWSMSHDFPTGADHLVISGTPPVDADAVESAIAAAAGNPSFDPLFELPVDAFAKRTGYRYGHDTGTLFSQLRRGLKSFCLWVPPAGQELAMTWFGLSTTGRTRSYPFGTLSMAELPDGSWVFLEEGSLELLADEFRELAVRVLGAVQIALVNEFNLYTLVERRDRDTVWGVRHRNGEPLHVIGQPPGLDAATASTAPMHVPIVLMGETLGWSFYDAQELEFHELVMK